MTQQALAQRPPAQPPVLSVNNATIGKRGIEINNFGDLVQYCEAYFKSGMAPKGVPNAQALVVMVNTGLEIGLSLNQSIQGLYPINNKIGIYAETALGVIRANPQCEYIRSFVEGVGDFMKGVCVSKRRGHNEERTEFSVADAKQAGLWNKRGKENSVTPWVTYPKRMIVARAIGFHGKDFWSDVLKGIPIVEENMDIESSVGAENRGSLATGKILDVAPLKAGALARAKVTLLDGREFNCNGEGLISKASIAQRNGVEVEITYREGQRGNDILNIESARAVIETEQPSNVEATPISVQEASFENSTADPIVEESHEIQPMNIGQLLTALRPLGVAKTMVERKWNKKVADMTESDLTVIREVYTKIAGGAPVEEFFGE
jgi:hypothetical protein